MTGAHGSKVVHSDLRESTCSCERIKTGPPSTVEAKLKNSPYGVCECEFIMCVCVLFCFLFFFGGEGREYFFSDSGG